MGFSNFLLKSLCCIILLATASTASAWTRSLTFEEGTVGSKAQGTASDFDDAAGRSFITTDQVLNGRQAAQLNIEQGDTGFGRWGGIINFPEPLRKGDEIWFSVNTFFPTGFNYNSTGEGGHLKFLRIHTSTPGGDNRGYNDWYVNPEGSSVPHKFICECQARWFEYGTPEDSIRRNVWESYEMYVRLDNIPTDQGGTALVRVWKNGELLREITGAKTLASATDISTRAHLFTYWNGASPKTQFMYVDDIVVTSRTPSYTDARGNPLTTSSSAQAPSSTSKPEPPILSIE